MKKIIAIIFLAVIALFTVACGEEQQQEKEYTVAYINEHLDASRYQKLEYIKEITFDSVLLLEVKLTSELKDSEYTNVTVTKKLADITSNEQYEETTEETKSKNIENPISLKLDESYFQTVTINEKSLSGVVHQEKVKDVINVETASDLEIKVTLSDDLKVKTIEIKYVDTLSGYQVSMKANYTF